LPTLESYALAGSGGNAAESFGNAVMPMVVVGRLISLRSRVRNFGYTLGSSWRSLARVSPHIP